LVVQRTEQRGVDMSRVSLLEGLFPASVRAAEASEDDFGGQLWPSEQALIESAVPARHREFTGGRVLARRLIVDLDLPERAIPSGPTRAPAWPEGVVGSISHTGDRCVVAVARRTDIAMLGVDIEVCRDLDRLLWPEVCAPEELAWLAEQPAEDRGWLATLLFSAKECGYKAQYPLTQTFVDFQQGRVAVHRQSDAEGTFEVGYPEEVASRLPVPNPRGRWAIREGLVITALAVIQPPGDAPLRGSPRTERPRTA